MNTLEKPNNIIAKEVIRTFPEKRSVAMILLFAFIFQLGAVLAVEQIFAMAGIGEELIQLDDPILGYRHRKNKSVTWRREGFGQTYFGSNGLMEEVAPGVHPGIYRIAILGDSMVESLQNPQEKSAAKLLEKRLQAEHPDKKIQILNCGVFGYSTVQEYLYLKEILKTYKPDLVMLAYDTRDMAESIETWVPKGMRPTGARPYAMKLAKQELDVSSLPVQNDLNSPKKRFWDNFEWFKQNSRIWGFVSEGRQKISLHNALVESLLSIGKPTQEAKKPAFSIKFFEKNQTAPEKTAEKISTNKDANIAGASEDRKSNTPVMTASEKEARAAYLTILDDTFGALLSRMKSDCQENGAKFCVFALPGRSELLPDIKMAESMHNVSVTDELQFVSKQCQEKSVPFLDCHSQLKTKPKEETRKMFYLLHLTAAGNEYLAEKLDPFVSSIVVNKTDRND